MFEMIFGSDKFESLLGELAISMTASMEDNHPPELIEFKQKKREVFIAMNLVNNLVQFQADMEAKTEYLFLDTHEKAKELSSNPMGKLLVGKIGMLYIEQSK